MAQNANVKPYQITAVVNQNGMTVTAALVQDGDELTVVANQNGMNVTLIEHI